MKADPPVVEALLLPFSVAGKTVGTIWVVAHDERRKFDAEDERMVTTLAKFASAAWQLWSARMAAESAKAALEEKVADLESLHDIIVGRELKMIQLEKEMATLRLEPRRHNLRSIALIESTPPVSAEPPRILGVG